MTHALYKIITTEYFFILFACLVVCLTKFVIDYREKRIAGKVSHLKSILKEVIAGRRVWDENEWTQKKESIDILLRVLETFDAIIDSGVWNRVKGIICETRLLPWARTHAASLLWSQRNKAMRIFLLYPKTMDIPIMESLLNDTSFFIRMGAVAALAKISSPEVTSLLLSHMAAERPIARFPYRHALLNMPLESLIFLSDIYQDCDDEDIRLACLDIISHRFIFNPIKMIRMDYHSPHARIRLFIVKILGNLASEEAVTDLVLFLKDPDPKVRAETVLSLGKLVSEKSFENVIEMLHDENYEVRLQAAIALTKFGEKGIHALETQDWDVDPKAFEVARYVLTMP